MKVLLRESKTGHYYAGPGEWVREREDAADFRLIERALEANTREDLGATHVVLAYDLPARNLALPIANYVGIIDSGSSTELPNRSASNTI